MEHRSPERDTSNSLSVGVAAVLLDAVGTLITPVPSVAEAYTAAALRQGVILEVGDVRARFHVAFHNDGIDAGRGAHSTDEETERRRWHQIVVQVLPEASDPDRAFDELWEHFGRPDSWRVFPDVAPAIDELRVRGISVCVGSNFDRRLRAVLGGLPELAMWARDLLISSEVGYRKPHPTFFHAVCAHLGLPPEHVLCVGDDPENDVRGAMNAGLTALWLDRAANGVGDLPYLPNLTALVEAVSGRA
jgi:putative hydrolase of the HAD superfamily